MRSLSEKIPCNPRQVTFVRREEHGKIGGMAIENLDEPLPGRMPSHKLIADPPHLAELRSIICEQVIDRTRDGLLEDLRDGAGGRAIDVRIAHV